MSVNHTWSISFCKWLYAETGLCAIAGFERFKKKKKNNNKKKSTQFVRSLEVEGAWYVRVLSVFRQCLCVRNWLLARTSLTNHLQNTHISLTKHAQSTYVPLTITYPKLLTHETRTNNVRKTYKLRMNTHASLMNHLQITHAIFMYKSSHFGQFFSVVHAAKGYTSRSPSSRRRPSSTRRH